MLPQNATIPGAVEIVQQAQLPTCTYHWNIKVDRIRGYTDGQIAMKQANYKILMTERFEHVIYSHGYGIELLELFGQPIPYCVSEIKRRVTEALLHDDRNLDVTRFEFDLSRKETVQVEFRVHTIFGEIEMNLEVPV